LASVAQVVSIESESAVQANSVLAERAVLAVSVAQVASTRSGLAELVVSMASAARDD
jgi:hypothetical protein